MREGVRAGCLQYNCRENEVGSIDQEEREGNARGSMSRLSAVQPQRERGGEHRPGGARRKCVRECEQALHSTTAERTRWGKEVSTKKLYGGERTATIQAGRFPFDSNPIQNKSPARRTLYLVVSVMQSFEATCWLPKIKHKQY